MTQHDWWSRHIISRIYISFFAEYISMLSKFKIIIIIIITTLPFYNFLSMNIYLFCCLCETRDSRDSTKEKSSDKFWSASSSDRVSKEQIEDINNLKFIIMLNIQYAFKLTWRSIFNIDLKTHLKRPSNNIHSIHSIKIVLISLKNICYRCNLEQFVAPLPSLVL